MMSSENIPPASHPPDHIHNQNGSSTAAARKSAAQKPQEQPPSLKCPRCDSSNTKFCYYNNYSLTQPRHFCKTCRRYWTKGGALRNVPIGGGCRKTKKHKPSPSSCPTTSLPTRLDLSAGPGGVSEFKFLAPPTVAPAMEFQLGGLSLPRLHPATAGVYTQFIASSGANLPPTGDAGTGGCFSLDLLGLGNYPTIPNSGSSSSPSSSSLSLAGGGVTGGGDQPISISSIESLSSINQEMHWKLQQQRLAMIYGQPTNDEDDSNNNNYQEKGLGVGVGGISLFKNMGSTRNNNKLADVGGPTPTEWLFDQLQTNSSSVNYADNNNNNNTCTTSVGATTTTSCKDNNHEDFNGIWTTAELHHHQHHQFNGLQ